MPENPYDALVLQETLKLRDLETSPTPPMMDPEEVARRKAMMDQQYNTGLLGSLSPNADVHRVGGKILSNALEAEKMHYGNAGVYDPTTMEHIPYGDVKRTREIEASQRRLTAAELKAAQVEAERARAAQLEAVLAPVRAAEVRLKAARTKVLEDKANEGIKIPTKEVEHLRQLGDDYANMQNIEKKVKDGYTQTTGISPLEKTLDSLVRAAPGPVEFFGGDQLIKNQEIWADVQRLGEMKNRRENFGLTLTGHELASWREVTPPRGLSPEKLQEWVKKQKDLLDRALQWDIDRALAAKFNKREIEALTRGAYKAPEDQPIPDPDAAPTPAIPSPSPGGGRTYWDPATKSFRRG